MNHNKKKTALTAGELSNVQIEKIIDSIDEAITGCDSNGYINFFNFASERRESISRREMLNKHIEEVYDFHGKRSLLMQAIRAEKPILDQYQEYTVKRNGKLIEIICSTVPIVDNGKVIGAVSVMKDYSKVKKLSNIIMDLQSNFVQDGSNNEAKPRISGARHTFEDIIGKNKQLLDTLNWARKTAENKMPVLIYGETGTGKELVTQSIHNASKRKNKPFIAINCAAIPENLLESLLFGTTKGAFTGAVDKPGLFEQAFGGTIMLDEINSMPTSLQSKILRVIQEESVLRVGDVKERKTDVRIISTSNQEPGLSIKHKQLREDLYYRIAYISLKLPPLRDRIDDLPILRDYFVNKYKLELNLDINGISDELMEVMKRYSWPGNVRELSHVIAAGLSAKTEDGELLHLNDLPPNVKYKFNDNAIDIPKSQGNIPLHEQLEKLEMSAIKRALDENQWNISKTANVLGLKRQTLQHKIKKYFLSSVNS